MFRFGSWGLVIKLNFRSHFDHKVWSRFWSWSSGKILKPGLVNILNFKLRWDADVCWCRYVKVGAWSIFWRWKLIKFCVRPCDMTKISNFGKQNSILGSVVPLAMFNILYYILLSVLRQGCNSETAFHVVVAFYLLGKMMRRRVTRSLKWGFSVPVPQFDEFQIVP